MDMDLTLLDGLMPKERFITSSIISKHAKALKT
jgi:hypothetical protein